MEKGLNLDDNLWYNKCLIDDGCSLKKVCFVNCTNLEIKDRLEILKESCEVLNES